MSNGGTNRSAPGTENWAAGAVFSDHEAPARQGVGPRTSCPSPMALRRVPLAGPQRREYP
jgi:hypothetical protein